MSTNTSIRSHSSNMPPEIRARLHSDFLENEEAFVALRPQLLESHTGLWVAVAGGHVIAAGRRFQDVADQAASFGGHPYVAFVSEPEIEIRIRRHEFAYDHDYEPFALPLITASFSNDQGAITSEFDNVIPDTGADLSVLPESDCVRIDLLSSFYYSISSSGVMGAATPTVAYRAQVEIAGQTHRAYIQPIPEGTERIVGRDVLNQRRVLFDGLSGIVTFDP